jgi:lipoprotein-anchoring transpeptidase ErfK/SrfK
MKIVVVMLAVAVLVFGGLYWYIAHQGAKDPGNSPAASAPTVSKDDTAKAAELFKQAKNAAAEGQSAKAQSLYEQVARDFPDTWSGREANLELGNIYLKQGMKKEAGDAFRKGLPNVPEDKKPAILATLQQIEGDLAGKPEKAPAPAPASAEKAPSPSKASPPAEKPADDGTDTIYSVQKGDTLVSIARKFKTSVEQLKLVNNRTDDKLNIGDRIKISKQMPTLKISKKGLNLQLTFKGAMLKQYPVCIGKEAELTPAGDYTLGNKLKNPPWTPSGQKTIPYGDPRNILGTRWMTLICADGVQRGYGIHGTTLPESVPGRASAGCIRMLNADVEQLYEWIPVGTKVTITED